MAVSPRPTRFRRLAAAFLDGVLAMILALALAAAVPGVLKARMFGVGLLLGAAYLFLRDAIPYAEWGPRSLGKRWLGIRPYRTDGAALTWATSLRRNATIAGPGVLWAVLYLVGGYRGVPYGDFLMAACGVLVGVETLLILVDPSGRRIGDRLGTTRVIEARA